MHLIEPHINRFEAISLAEMDGVSLMNRTDTKFIIPQVLIPELLNEIIDDYRALEVEGKKISRYHSVYFDTPDMLYYHQHHRGKAKRVKVRMRKYVESELCFLEVKKKDKKGNTLKSRIIIPDFEKENKLNEDQRAFLEALAVPTNVLVPSIENSFSRITLVNKNLSERVTIDVNLCFNGKELLQGPSGGLAVIEMKQPGLDRGSALMAVLKKRLIRPFSVSKYCLGIALLNPKIKQNRFKTKILNINKILN